MEKIKDILEDRVYHVSTQMMTSINVNNGLLNKDMLERAKRSFIGQTVGVWKDELITTQESFPEDDISDVVFDIDVVLLKRKDFKLIKKYIEQSEQFSKG